MERSRRTGTKRVPHAGYAKLRELRESGKTRLATYEVEEEEKIYVEVDEEGYKKVVRDRLDQDDFVVDDNGEGYVDNGMDDWDDDERRHREESWDESGEDGKKKGKVKSAKRKRDDEARRKKEQDGNISKYFSSANIVPTIKPKKVVKDSARNYGFC